jgi:hypothetical protein
MKKIVSIIAVLVIAKSFQPLMAQRIIPKFIRKMYFEKDTSKRPSFVLIPVLSTAPETGVEVGGAGLYSFYTDTLHRETRVSNIYGYATITTKGQNRLSLSTSRWSPQNKYHYTVALNFLNFPNNFYGVGNDTRKADADLLDEKRYRLDFTAEKQVKRNLYIGFLSGAYYYKYDNKTVGGIFDTGANIEDRDGGPIVFLGPSLTYDSRDNNTYTTKGLLFLAQYRIIKGIFSNNGYVGGLLTIGYSQFFKMSNKFILAINGQVKSLTSGESPFYLLPQMGNDELMRGYYTGRFRDRNLIAGQAELRYRLSERFGLVGFGGAGQVFRDELAVRNFKPNLGGGLRYFFDVEKGLSLRVDYGIGQRPVGEQRLSGLYVALGQAF